jgi:hypothetical protein
MFFGLIEEACDTYSVSVHAQKPHSVTHQHHLEIFAVLQLPNGPCHRFTSFLFLQQFNKQSTRLMKEFMAQK